MVTISWCVPPRGGDILQGLLVTLVLGGMCLDGIELPTMCYQTYLPGLSCILSQYPSRIRALSQLLVAKEWQVIISFSSTYESSIPICRLYLLQFHRLEPSIVKDANASKSHTDDKKQLNFYSVCAAAIMD